MNISSYSPEWCHQRLKELQYQVGCHGDSSCGGEDGFGRIVVSANKGQSVTFVAKMSKNSTVNGEEKTQMDFLNTEQGRNIAIYDIVSNISPTVEIQFHSSWTISNNHSGSKSTALQWYCIKKWHGAQKRRWWVNGQWKVSNPYLDRSP